MPITRDDVIAWLNEYARMLEKEKDYLTRLDSEIGDADHGANMVRGFQAVLSKLATEADSDIATIFKMVGMTLVSTVGGASGPLYGTMFLQMAGPAARKEDLYISDWAAVLEAGLQGVIHRGKAALGDKTMVDTLVPAVRALQKSIVEGADLGTALRRSALAAEQGMQATIPLVARKGRASYLGERSAGHQDPGATSSYMLIQSAAKTWTNKL
jgi:dihydroxyacetone kinase-like protein